MLPVHIAVVDGDLEEVRRLIEEDPQAVNSLYQGYSPLYLALLKGHFQIMALLLDHGANIDYQEPCGGQTPLFAACREDRLPVVELLLEKGADPGIPTTYSCTPLMVASLRGYGNVVRCLLKHHHHQRTMSTPTTATTLTPLDDYQKALQYSCMKGHVEIVRMLLLETPVDPLSEEDGAPPIYVAKVKGHQECVKVIEEWERSYVLTKARRLYDARSYHHHRHMASPPSPPQDDDHNHDDDDGRAKKRARVEGVARAGVPTYLEGRVEKGQELPKVEVIVEEREEKVSVGGVLEHVVCGGLKGELFVELMEMAGKVGVRAQE